MNYKKAKLYDAESDLRKQWYVFFSYKHPETKKFEVFKVYISNKVKTKTERYSKAKSIIKKYDELLDSGYNPFFANSKKNARLIEALEKIVAIRESRFTKEKTKQADVYVLKKLIRFLNLYNLQNKRCEEFSRQDAQDFQDWLLVDCKLANRTVNSIMTFSRTLFYELVNREYMVVNVFAKIKKLKMAQPTIVALTDKQMKIISKHLKNYDREVWAFSSFIYFAFMRTIEISRLQAKHLDLKHDVLLIDSGISKNVKQQPVIIVPRLKEIILEMKYDQLPTDWFLFGNCSRPGPRRVVPTAIQARWRKFANAHGLDGVNMYYLKHTANGHALDLGASVRDLQEHNRHHSLDQTQKYLDRFRRMGGTKINNLDGF